MFKFNVALRPHRDRQDCKGQEAHLDLHTASELLSPIQCPTRLQFKYTQRILWSTLRLVGFRCLDDVQCPHVSRFALSLLIVCRSSVASVKRPPADFPENSVPEKMSTVKPQVLSQWSGARRPALVLIDDLSCYC